MITRPLTHLGQGLNLFYAKSFQIFLLLRSKTITFRCFLNCLVVCPFFKTMLRNIGKCRLILLRQRSGKIPGCHHPDIVIFVPDRCSHFPIYRLKILVQEMIHQHFDSKPDGIGMICPDPASDARQQVFSVFLKYFGAELVTGCPVIDVRQEGFYAGNRSLKVHFPLQQEILYLVLFKATVRESIQKSLFFFQLPC